ncbi:MAG: hypothetical protein JXR77_00955 [Lentisphaeria bacterium]|nr:hypothetical protein [Lentisphaeria bacterium]
MNELDLIRGFYETLVAADFPHAGEVADDGARLQAVSVRGCHGNSKNLLFFSVTLNEGRVRAIRYDCQYCDVTLYVVAELVCRLLEEQPVTRLAELGDIEISALLGGESRKVLRQARVTLGLLRDALLAGRPPP